MIGRWGSWLLFIKAYMIVSCKVRGKTSYGGCLLARVYLRLSPSIERCRLEGRPLFLGRVFGSPRAKHIWDSVIEKIERQLVSWKVMYLSKCSTVTLLSAHFPICLSILCPSFLSQRVLQTVLGSFNVISNRVGYAKSSNIT
jgi:hypothetical protein